jgi:hypothetical protein
MPRKTLNGHVPEVPSHEPFLEALLCTIVHRAGGALALRVSDIVKVANNYTLDGQPTDDEECIVLTLRKIARSRTQPAHSNMDRHSHVARRL